MSERLFDVEPADERVRFLALLEPFSGLDPAELERVAASVEERLVPAGDVVMVESGLPGTHLYLVHEGTMELLHKQALVAILTRGETFGHLTLLTGLAPEFTARARTDCSVYCIPKDGAVALLSRPEGVKWLAGSQRERLLQAARSMSALPDARTRPVTEVVRSAPVFCDPDTTIRDAAQLMIDEGRSAILVSSRDGLGIVTDVDLRDKVVVGGISRDAPVSAIMTAPVHTIGAEVLAPEASIAMMVSGVNHLPVLDETGKVVGILSASNLMTLEARSPFALRHSIQSARTEKDLDDAAADMPELFLDLLDARLDAPSLTRVLTVLADTMTARLLELAIERHGEPPVPYAWLAFGSAARSELTLASDQDNGLAYADSDDPTVDEYFRHVAEDVNAGLERGGFSADPHGVLARNRMWRMSLSQWKEAFSYCLEGKDLDRLARASVAFDYRQVAGELYVDRALTDIMREAAAHHRFMRGLHQLGFRIPSPLGFRGRLVGYLDIKKSGLVPLQNLARYWAFSKGITAQTTLERLVAVAEAEGRDPMSESDRSLREAFASMSYLQLRHHANAIRNGRPLDNVVDTTTLRPLDHANLQEALRLVAAEQKRFPFLPLPRL
jgi:CBS domain-containing protein